MLPSLLLHLAAALVSAPARAEEAPHDANSAAARVEASAGLGVESGPPTASIGLSAGVSAGRAVIEADLGVGLDTSFQPLVTGLVGTRVYLGPEGAVYRRGFAVTAAAGGGWWQDVPHPLARLGVAYDHPLREIAALRVALAWQAGGGGAGALVAGVGLAWRGDAAPTSRVATTKAPPSASPAAPLLLTVDPPDALVWVPHPICDWVPASELANVLPPDASAIVLQVRAEGFLPTEVVYDANAGPQSVSLRQAPASGAVVVVASPGDRLYIDDKAFPLAEDGTAVFGAAEGPVAVEIIGGGRRAILEGVVAGGYALWLRAPDPVPLVVTFPSGSSVVPPEAEPSIRAFAQTLGANQLRVVGYYATDDGGESRRLGAGRAEALAAALLAAGVSIDNVKVLSSSRPPADLTPEEQRSARIELLPPDRRQ